MSKTYLTVIAKVKAKSDKIEEVKSELLALINPTHQEEGCVSYDLHQSNSDPSLFFFYENWTDQEKLDKHLSSQHLQHFVTKVSGFLDDAVEINLMTKLGQSKLAKVKV